MKIRSPALETDLIFSRFAGEIVDRGEYIAVKTPKRPHYFWGNYLIMPHAPRRGDLDRWQHFYNSEFNSREQGFMTFAIDADGIDAEAAAEFVAEGFRLTTTKVLTAATVHAPPYLNSRAVVREIRTHDEWSQIVDVHMSNEWYLSPESQRPFLVEKIKDLRAIAEAGLGRRFGAFIDGKLAADLGIYRSNRVGRFNEVATHEDFRRQGLCGTLVYHAARTALSEMDIDLLVMAADENYHAARIYESVGFQPTDRHLSLEWFDPLKHG